MVGSAHDGGKSAVHFGETPVRYFAEVGTSARRGRPPLVLELTPEEATGLSARVRAPTSTQRDAARARIILACADSGSARQIAACFENPRRRVERWRGRFLRKRLKGLGISNDVAMLSRSAR